MKWTIFVTFLCRQDPKMQHKGDSRYKNQAQRIRNFTEGKTHSMGMYIAQVKVEAQTSHEAHGKPSLNTEHGQQTQNRHYPTTPDHHNMTDIH